MMLSIGKVLSLKSELDEIVENDHIAGLHCTYNFMFGLPGETEEDAKNSLEFLRKHKDHVGTVNPSPAFCGLTPGTPGKDNPEKFGIKPDPSEGKQYWESLDGTNTLMTRLRRFESFCELADDLGVRTTYPHRKLLDRDRVIAHYAYFFKDYETAAFHFALWLIENPTDDEARVILVDCKAKLREKQALREEITSAFALGHFS